MDIHGDQTAARKDLSQALHEGLGGVDPRARYHLLNLAWSADVLNDSTDAMERVATDVRGTRARGEDEEACLWRLCAALRAEVAKLAEELEE